MSSLTEAFLELAVEAIEVLDDIEGEGSLTWLFLVGNAGGWEEVLLRSGDDLEDSELNFGLELDLC